MAKIVDLQKYRQSKVFIHELTALSNDYEYILRALGSIQLGLNKWGKYKSPLMAAYKVEEVKVYFQHELHRLRAVIKLERGLIDE
jgi:hypothetical protein